MATDVNKDASGTDDQGGTKDTALVLPKDGSVVPRERMNEAVAREREIADALRAELTELRGQVVAKPKETEKVYSAAELQAAVDAGQMSAAEMATIAATQAAKAVRTEVNADTEAQKTAAAQDETYNRYFAVKPTLRDKSSDDFKRVAAEYQELVKTGSPQTRATELAAVRAVFGSVDALEAAKTRGARETHQETGGSGGGNDRPNDGGSVWKGIPAKNRSFYERQIAKGIYKNTDDPALKSELDYIRTRGKQAA